MDFLGYEGIYLASGETLKIDGRKHRCTISGDKPRSKNGEYRIFADEWPRGWLHNWKTDEFYMWDPHKNGDSAFSSMSNEEKRALAEKWEAERAEKKKREALSQAQASALARSKWEAATPASPAHTYAMKKRLTNVYGARLLGSDLIWPMYDASGEIVNIQTITTQGVKRPQTGAPKTGNFGLLLHPLPSGSAHPRAETEGEESTNPPYFPQPHEEYLHEGEAGPDGGYPEENEEGPARGFGSGLSSRVWITEGWATGCTVADATGESVVIAVDCGNLMPVVKNVRRAWPEKEFIIAADNDRKTNGNPGVNAAIKVFEETGVPFVYPNFCEGDEGTDWNDFACLYGVKRCRAHMLKKLDAFKKKGLYKLKHSAPQFVDLTDGGRVLGTVENLRALLAFAGMTVSYNEIKKEEVFSMPGRSYCGDNAKNAAMGEILSLCSRWRFPKSDIEPLISNIGSQNISNPVKDWILSEPWDGMGRIQNVYDSLVEERGFPREFKEILVKRWLISGIAAVFMERGFHCRGVLTFVGGQGIGKTSWFRTLFGKDEFFSEGVGLNLRDKDSIKSAISAWGVEYGELEGTFNRSEIPTLKAFITRSSDKIRMPWSRKESDFQRRTIYGATVNQRQFLLDDTGNARWWCVPLSRINKLDRGEMQQMWREVYERFYLAHLREPNNEDYQWWLTKEEDMLLEKQNHEFEVPSGIEEMIVAGLEWDCMRELWQLRTTTQILHDCGYPPVAPKPGELVKAAKVLTRLTGEKSRPMGHSNARMWRVPPKRTMPKDFTEEELNNVK